jgi:arylsulfatase A-like enzyme
MATGCDWLPTIAELCAVPVPRVKLDGKSLVPVILSADAPGAHKTFYWQLGPQWVVREGGWKLLGNPRDNSKKAEITKQDHPFLVNLAEDVSEVRNQAKEHPDVVQRLAKLRDECVRDIADR